MNYLNKYSLISCHQFGFQKGISTIDAILKLTEFIYRSLNKKLHTISVFVDLKKTFDTVNHDILLRKLSCYGIRGIPLGLIKNYLNTRSQCVKIGSVSSGYKTINIGVPQGSIMGPLLFLLYINDLPNVSSVLSSVLFADDTTLFASDICHYRLIESFNSELEKVAMWTKANMLSLNVNKTFAVSFTNREPGDCFHMLFFDGEQVQFNTSGKFLGLIIDSSLNFRDHISMIYNKISKTIGIFYRLKQIVPDYILLNLYYTFIYPYLLYCNVIWGGTHITVLAPLRILQKKNCPTHCG